MNALEKALQETAKKVDGEEGLDVVLDGPLEEAVGEVEEE